MPGVELQFPKDSQVLSASTARKLGTWLADIRVRYPNYDYFFVSVYKVGGETGEMQLVSARAETLRRFFLSRGFNSERVKAKAFDSFWDDPAKGTLARAANIEFLPACPHVCCHLETHRVEFTGLPMPTDSGMAAAGSEAR